MCTTSVSYTHLDVYKRQEAFSVVTDATGAPGGQCAINGSSCRRLCKNAKKNSYRK